MTDLNALAEVKQIHKLRHLLNYMPDKDFHLPRDEASDLLRYIDALRAAASSQAGVLAMREIITDAISFAGQVAVIDHIRGADGCVKAAKDSQAKWQATIDNIEVQAGVETATPSQEPVAVKPLEWDERGRADVYTVRQDGLRVDEKYFMARGDKILGWFDSEGIAKAAAQADFEQRIRSALVSPTPALRTALDQIIISAMEWHPSENGPSYIEHRADLQSMLNAALRSHSTPARDGNAEALRTAERSFEAIRLLLISNLDEPERSAFWLAVKSRDELRAALSTPAPAQQSPDPIWKTELSEIIGHLGSAIVQSCAKDDQIIMDHVKAAHEIAKIVRRKA